MRILEGKDALIYKMEHFMTILGELLFSLVYYSTINTYLFWKEIQNYEEFFDLTYNEKCNKINHKISDMVSCKKRGITIWQ